jgi:hypothetical protein
MLYRSQVFVKRVQLPRRNPTDIVRVTGSEWFHLTKSNIREDVNLTPIFEDPLPIKKKPPPPNINVFKRPSFHYHPHQQSPLPPTQKSRFFTPRRKSTIDVTLDQFLTQKD